MPAKARQVRKLGAAQAVDLQALRESEERFRRTFELAGSGLAHIGMDRRFIRVNRRLCEILGYPEHELLKLRGKDISHPEDSEVIDEQRPRLYAGKIDEVRLEKRYLKKDGAVVWVQFAMVVERDADGRPKYEIAVYDDITARREAEERLRQSEERFRRTFELAGSGLAQVSLDGRFLRVNPRACEIFGYSERELCALTVRDISHPDDRDLVDRPRARVLSGELDSARLEKRYIRKDGKVIWVSLAIAMERDAEGRPLYAISVLDDVTSRRQAEATLRDTEAHWRSVVNSANEGILVYDRALNVTAANLAAERILGLPLDRIIGAPGFTSLLPCVREDGSPLPEPERPTRRTMRAGQALTGIVVGVRRPEAAMTWLSVNTGFLRRSGEQEHYGVVSTITDITALREAHEELKRSNSELEQFAYVASHDLQEPLRMVSSYTQLLVRRYRDKLDGDATEFMGYIVDGAARMKQLIEDLLAYSRVGTKGTEFKPVELERSVRRAITNLKAAIDESGAAVSFEPLPTAPADEVQLAQVFQNLMGNALKFRSQSPPRIHIGTQDCGDFFEISVRDNGIGIEPQYFTRIFMLFQRLHDRGEYPGTGIGLAIVKKVVERHGGQVRVESKPGEGSAFIFTLPKHQKEAANGG